MAECAWCGKDTAHFKCGKCGAAAYCDEACQRSDFATHATVCAPAPIVDNTKTRRWPKQLLNHAYAVLDSRQFWHMAFQDIDRSVDKSRGITASAIAQWTNSLRKVALASVWSFYHPSDEALPQNYEIHALQLLMESWAVGAMPASATETLEDVLYAPIAQTLLMNGTSHCVLALVGGRADLISETPITITQESLVDMTIVCDTPVTISSPLMQTVIPSGSFRIPQADLVVGLGPQAILAYIGRDERCFVPPLTVRSASAATAAVSFDARHLLSLLNPVWVRKTVGRSSTLRFSGANDVYIALLDPITGRVAYRVPLGYLIGSNGEFRFIEKEFIKFNELSYPAAQKKIAIAGVANRGAVVADALLYTPTFMESVFTSFYDKIVAETANRQSELEEHLVIDAIAPQLQLTISSLSESGIFG